MNISHKNNKTLITTIAATLFLSSTANSSPIEHKNQEISTLDNHEDKEPLQKLQDINNEKKFKETQVEEIYKELNAL